MWKKFDISTTTNSIDNLTIQIVHVKGYLDSSTFPQLQTHLQNLIQQGHFRLIVEFGDLNYISSAGLGVLMGMLQEVRNQDGDLKLANMSSKIQHLFDMLGFSRLIRIYDTVENASQAFVADTKTEEKTEEQKPEDSY
ncbi:anti-sigma factor antagonist [bacterium]|nr:anti-sigma factor antagonist [bacterium]